MKILHTVEYYYPSVGGAQEVVKQLSERLAILGHDVTVATTRLAERESNNINGVKVVEFDVSGKMVTGYSGKDIKKYKDFITNSGYDVIMNYAAQQWATDLMIDAIDDVKSKKVIVPCGFSGLNNALYKDYFKEMPNWLKKYDASVYLSDDYRDINFARKHKAKNLHLIPNGAGRDEFDKTPNIEIRKKLKIPKNNFVILSVGSHTGAKGHIEAIEIFEKADIKNATLLIVANDFGDEGCSRICKRKNKIAKFLPRYIKTNKQLIIKELPRDMTIATYKDADVFLFPSNIEASPLVLFEAMASGLPFLSTDVGNASEIIEWSGGGKLLPTHIDSEGISHADIEGSARLLEEWFIDPAKNTFGKKGYEAWKKTLHVGEDNKTI